jgi:hypothetical protein
VSDQPNEILAAAAAAKQHETAAEKAKRARHDRGWDLGKIGLGVGIGSAAIAAAVLFTRKKD